MKIPFTKMHGCGNDYIYIDARFAEPDDPSALSVKMSPRHTSVGADGLVLICRSDVADAKMRMFNLDGSEGMMCGNAIRCVGKYLYDIGIANGIDNGIANGIDNGIANGIDNGIANGIDNGVVDKTELTVETKSGIKSLSLHVRDGKVTDVTVDMGHASFLAADIPVLSNAAEVIDEPFAIGEPFAGETWRLTCVSMGNPHAVTFVDDVASLDLAHIGPMFENHPIFPQRVNTEFIRVIDRQNLEMRVWERGSGETFACGTGACAAVSAAVRLGICDVGVPVTVHLLGGVLEILVTDGYTVRMTGEAVKVYDGIYEF